jgi:hypothetical protein
MHSLPCFALLVLLLAAAKIHFEEQALVAGTKHSCQAAKSGEKHSSQADKASRPACFVLCPLALFCA